MPLRDHMIVYVGFRMKNKINQSVGDFLLEFVDQASDKLELISIIIFFLLIILFNYFYLVRACGFVHFFHFTFIFPLTYLSHISILALTFSPTIFFIITDLVNPQRYIRYRFVYQLLCALTNKFSSWAWLFWQWSEQLASLWYWGHITIQGLISLCLLRCYFRISNIWNLGL